MKTDKYSIIVIGMLVLLAVILRHPGYIYIERHRDELGFSGWAAWSVSMAAVGLITFFGFVWLGFRQGGQMALHREGMRLAIAASVVVLDLVLVSTVIFPFRLVGMQGGEVPELAKDVLSQFNWTVGIIAAFYFATSAYAQIHEKDKGDTGSKEPEETK